MNTAADLKSAAKAVRSYPALNVPITNLLRAGLRASAGSLLGSPRICPEAESSVCPCRTRSA